MNQLIHNDIIIHELAGSIVEGGAALRHVPGLLKKTIREDAWRKRTVRVTGEVVEFSTFPEFVEAGPPEGLSVDFKTLKRLCADDAEALSLIDEVTTEGHGGDRRSEGFNVSIRNVETDRPVGTTRQHALRKLRKDRPDLHQRVIKGEVSPHGAMVEAGFRRKTITVPLEVGAAAQTLRRHFDAGQLREIAARLAGD